MSLFDISVQLPSWPACTITANVPTALHSAAAYRHGVKRLYSGLKTPQPQMTLEST